MSVSIRHPRHVPMLGTMLALVEYDPGLYRELRDELRKDSPLEPHPMIWDGKLVVSMVDNRVPGFRDFIIGQYDLWEDIVSELTQRGDRAQYDALWDQIKAGKLEFDYVPKPALFRPSVRKLFACW